MYVKWKKMGREVIGESREWENGVTPIFLIAYC